MHQICSARSRFHIFVDLLNLPVLPDVERPSASKIARAIEYTIIRRYSLLRIAQNRVVEIERFSEFLVRLRIVDTGRKISYIKICQFFTAVTQRLTFQRSASSECFREPGNHHCLLSHKLAQVINLAV